PYPPQRRGGAAKALAITAVAVVALAVVGGGLYWFFGYKGPKDDGPHKLTAPTSMSFATYYRAGDATDPKVGTDDPKELEWLEFKKKPTEIAAGYSDELLDGVDT